MVLLPQQVWGSESETAFISTIKYDSVKTPKDYHSSAERTEDQVGRGSSVSQTLDQGHLLQFRHGHAEPRYRSFFQKSS